MSSLHHHMPPINLQHTGAVEILTDNNYWESDSDSQPEYVLLVI